MPFFDYISHKIIRKSDPVVILDYSRTEDEILSSYNSLCQYVNDSMTQGESGVSANKTLALSRLKDARDYLLHQIGKLDTPLTDENFFHRIAPIVNGLSPTDNKPLKAETIELLKQLIHQEPSVANLTVGPLNLLTHAILRNMRGLAMWLMDRGASLHDAHELPLGFSALETAVKNDAWWFWEHLTDCGVSDETLIMTVLSRKNNISVCERVLTHCYTERQRSLSPELKKFIIEKDPQYIVILEQCNLISSEEAKPIKLANFVGNPKMYELFSLEDRKTPFYIIALLAQQEELKKLFHVHVGRIIALIPLNELNEEFVRALIFMYGDQLKGHPDFNKYAPWPCRDEVQGITVSVSAIAALASAVALVAGLITAATCGYLVLGAVVFVGLSALITSISEIILKSKNTEIGLVKEVLNQHGMFKSKPKAHSDIDVSDELTDNSVTLDSLLSMTS